jgi:hypothetical protein
MVGECRMLVVLHRHFELPTLRRWAFSR